MIITQGFLETRPLSYSSLKAFRKSPKHYIKYLTEEKVDTDVFLMGKLVECLLLEPENVDKRFRVFEKPNLRTNAGKEEMEQILADANEKGYALVDRSIMETAKKSAEAVMSYDTSKALIEGKIKSQIRLKWKDHKTNLPLIGYVDFETKAWESDFIVDLKTTKDADPDEFIKSAVKFDYHIQCGSYMEGYPRVKFKFPHFAFLAVETSEPFNVSVMFCDNDYIQKAKDEFLGTLLAFKRCLDLQQFDQGYEFRLMDTKPYHSMALPGYYKPKFIGV